METLSFERWKFGHYFKLVERQEKKSDFELKDEPGADTSIHQGWGDVIDDVDANKNNCTSMRHPTKTNNGGSKQQQQQYQ